MLSCLVALHELRPLLPAAVLTAASIPYFCSAFTWRVLSSVLPESVYHYVDDRMYSFYQRLVLFFFENVSGVQLILYGDLGEIKEKSPENVLYISNHQCTVDWAVADMVAIRQNCLGSLRYILKHQLQYLPLYGWYFYQHGCVYVRRSGGLEVERFRRNLARLGEISQPSWLVIFPEGTRFSPLNSEARRRSEEFARAQGVAPLRHVLFPRARGLQLALETLRPRLDAIYDVTIAYSQSRDERSGQQRTAPSMFDFVCAPPGAQLHVLVQRIPVSQVPDGPELQKWLYERFRAKDHLLSQFHAGWGAFPGVNGVVSPLPLRKTLPAFLVFSGSLVWFSMNRASRRFFLATWLAGSIVCILWMKIVKPA